MLSYLFVIAVAMAIIGSQHEAFAEQRRAEPRTLCSVPDSAEQSPAEKYLKKNQRHAEDFEYPKWSQNCKSLLRKYLTPDVFQDLRYRVTSSDITLRQVANSGIINQDSSIGAYLGDAECLKVFEPLFKGIVEDYHRPYTVDHIHPADFDPSHLPSYIGNADPSGKYVISTRIRVARNLKGYPLTPAISKQQRLEVEQRIVEVLEGLTGELAGTYHSLGSLEEATRQQLVEDHFLFKKGDRFLEEAGINRHWPEGRGIFFNKRKTFLVWVNEEDELRIISMQPGADIRAVFTRLATAVNALSSKLGFAFDEHYGYLAACPTNLGTGMRASVHIRIPKAVQQGDDFHSILDEFHLDARGIHGEHSKSVGGVYDISNKRRLGLSEVQCVDDMFQGVKRLIELEHRLESSNL